LARLNHPGVVTVHDVVREDDRPWIIMEFVRGARPLQAIIDQDGPLPPRRVAEIGRQLLDALNHAHAAGILHRDVKPSNVMIADDGHAVLTDFGIAQMADEVTLTQTGLVMGSPAYIAPERVKGDKAVPASDLWALGATLYTAVEGHSPYERGDAMAALAATLTEDPPPPRRAGRLGPIIQGLLVRDPARRMPAAAALPLLADAAVADPLPYPRPFGAFYGEWAEQYDADSYRARQGEAQSRGAQPYGLGSYGSYGADSGGSEAEERSLDDEDRSPVEPTRFEPDPGAYGPGSQPQYAAQMPSVALQRSLWSTDEGVSQRPGGPFWRGLGRFLFDGVAFVVRLAFIVAQLLWRTLRRLLRVFSSHTRARGGRIEEPRPLWHAFTDGVGGVFDLFGSIHTTQEPPLPFEASIADEVHQLCLTLGLDPEGRHREGDEPQ
jgi:hypothetical protein